MKTKINCHGFMVGFTIVLCVILAVGAYSLSEYTLIGFYVVVACSALMALLSGVVMWKSRFWKWLTGRSSFLPNYMCHSICVGILLSSLFYILNFAFADDSSRHSENAVVEKVYNKVRYKRRKVSRNRYVRGESYNVYYMNVRLGNGDIKELQIKFQEYTRLHKGDSIALPVYAGLFGVSVIKR